MRVRHLVLAVFLVCLPARAERLKQGDWIGSAGVGFISSPALFLLTPHLERVFRPNVFLGALMQAGFGGPNAIVTLSATVRYQFGIHPRLRPTVEGGIGFTAATASFSSMFGVALHLGMGVEYLLNHDLALSTVVRANFSPPVTGMFLSWPFLQIRYLF